MNLKIIAAFFLIGCAFGFAGQEMRNVERCHGSVEQCRRL